jgi:hypothetical protein
MMRLSGELGQCKTVMISSAAIIPAIAAGQPGNSIRTETPRALDKNRCSRDTEFT